MARKNRRTDDGIAARRYVPSIAARSIDGHILRTDQQVYAWYRLAPQRWSFRSDSQREGLIAAIAGQYAELQGRWLHLRVTSRPFPIRAWAEAHAANARDRLPDVEGALSFDDYLEGEQRQLLGRSMSEKEVYLGVQVQTRNVVDVAVERAAPLLRKVFPAAVDAELVALDSEIEHLDQVMARPGLQGRPVTAQQMWWLMHRSATLGLPAPLQPPNGLDGAWGTEDLASFADAAEMVQEPYAPTVLVNGQTMQHPNQQRHVAILSVGRMHDLQIPELDPPWMQLSDRLPVPVEWSARIFVRKPGTVAQELHRQSNKVRSQERHYVREHNLEPPRALRRQLSQVAAIDDQMTSGFTALATRVKSWWRVAVSGRDEKQALQRAQQLVDTYGEKIVLEHPEGQWALAREFMPGEPMATTAHRRNGPVTWAAAAVPQATADVGDRRGVLLGETWGATRRPVAWDPWMAQEVRDSSGLTAVVAGLGGGKSFLGAAIAYKAVRAGARFTILDPSGPLARLCELPELAPFSRVINLMRAQPGILNPYRVVADPRFEDYAGEENGQEEFRHDLKWAAATRRRLVQDVLTNVLPLEVARKAETKAAILEAVQAVGNPPDAHPGMVIEALTRLDSEHAAHGRVVHRFLRELADRLTLLIPEPGQDPYAAPRDDRLTVLTMAGLTLPQDGTSREHWTDAEALGVELLNLAAWLTQRSIYERPKHERKGVWIDEAFFLSEVPTGRVLMNRFARDSRKWNVRVMLSSQIPADFLRINGFVSLVDSVFVGRLDGDEAQADALRLLKVPTDAGYEQVLAAMSQRPAAATDERDQSPRQFVFGDGANNVEMISVDISGGHLKHLRDALDTTPGSQDQAEQQQGTGRATSAPPETPAQHGDPEATVRGLAPVTVAGQPPGQQ
ncbi:ATP-binding protein [Saccharopolyspora sp. NPDC000359]|uniref:ATP-binding protein n=1 Tax=Saccharopolyspora sp. NPDC000359 TaxID=3154251 RepID=UPI00332EA313